MNRNNALIRVIEFDEPVENLTNLLSNYSWDYDGEPLTITAAHIRSVLNKFLLSQISAESIEKWANLIELREDLDFDDNYYSKIEEIIHFLANPELEGELNKHICINFLASLE